MAYKTGILLGRIIKVKGYEGTVTISLERTFTEKIPEMKSVFLEIEGKPVPFFIAEQEIRGEHKMKVRFEGYGSILKTGELAGCRVFLDPAEGHKVSESDLPDLKGFSIRSDDDNSAGRIKEVIENPGQLLLRVESDIGKELLIPLHEDLIVKVDLKKRLIIMHLPEGLTEIN